MSNISRKSSLNDFVKRLLLLFTVTVVCSGITLAETSENDNTILKQALFDANSSRFSLKKLSRYLESVFQAIDRNRDGIQLEEIDLYDRKGKARLRADGARSVLVYDLDGDMISTRAEVTVFFGHNFPTGKMNEAARKRQQKQLDSLVNKIFAKDPNQDDRIEPDEYIAFARHVPRKKSRPEAISAFATLMLARDPNSDGVLTKEEAWGMIAKVYPDVKIRPPRK